MLVTSQTCGDTDEQCLQSVALGLATANYDIALCVADMHSEVYDTVKLHHRQCRQCRRCRAACHMQRSLSLLPKLHGGQSSVQVLLLPQGGHRRWSVDCMLFLRFILSSAVQHAFLQLLPLFCFPLLHSWDARPAATLLYPPNQLGLPC